MALSSSPTGAAKTHVRFTPNSDRKSGFPRKVMSALPPKADMCGAQAYVRYGPIADVITMVGLTLLPKFLCIFPVLTIKIFWLQGREIKLVNASHVDVNLVRI